MEVDELLDLVSACNHLRAASMGTCKLVYSTDNVQEVESISIEIWPRYDTKVARMFAVAVLQRTYQTLQRLQVAHYSDYNLDDIDTFARLSVLSLKDCWELHNAELTFILRTTPHVVHLDVSGCCTLSDKSGEFIAENMVQRRTLEVSRTGMGNRTMAALGKYLANTLHALNIDNCCGVKLGGLCEVLQKCTSLRVLHANTWILSQCYETYPDLLQQLTTLTLKVHRNEIYFVARLPKVCKSLQYICLCGCEYIVGLDFSAFTVQNLPHLHTIHVVCWKQLVSEDCPSLAALRVERPTLKVLFDILDVRDTILDVMKTSL